MQEDTSFKNFSYIGIGRAISLALQAVFYLLFAALLEPEFYGQLSVILALAGTFSMISIFGLHFTVQVYQAKSQSKISDQINTLALITSSIAAVILLTIESIRPLYILGAAAT